MIDQRLEKGIRWKDVWVGDDVIEVLTSSRFISYATENSRRFARIGARTIEDSGERRIRSSRMCSSNTVLVRSVTQAVKYAASWTPQPRAGDRNSASGPDCRAD